MGPTRSAVAAASVMAEVHPPEPVGGIENLSTQVTSRSRLTVQAVLQRHRRSMCGLASSTTISQDIK